MTIFRKRGARVLLVAVATVGLVAVPVVTRSANAADAPEITVSRTQVYPDASDAKLRSLRVRVNASTLPVQVQLSRNGRVVQTKTVTTSGTSVSFAMAALSTGAYSVIASDGQESDKVRVLVARGWAPISPDRPSWQSCSVVKWSYDPSGAPAGGDIDLRKDARAAFATLALATGLTFKAVSTGGALEVRWGAAGGADGLGGLSWTGGAGSAVSGYVELNRSSTWAKDPGTNDRGVLLLHEASHALGLGHVALDRSLMSPTYRPGITNPTLGAGEKAAYTTMYRPGTCG